MRFPIVAFSYLITVAIFAWVLKSYASQLEYVVHRVEVIENAMVELNSKVSR